MAAGPACFFQFFRLETSRLYFAGRSRGDHFCGGSRFSIRKQPRIATALDARPRGGDFDRNNRTLAVFRDALCGRGFREVADRGG